MKYNEDTFNSAVEDYKNIIKKKFSKGENFFIVFDINNKEAFYSMAPLSRALHELEADISCIGINNKSDALDALKDVWKIFEEYKNRVKNDKTNALIGFINEVDKKANGEFEKIFAGPDVFLEAKQERFEGSLGLPYHTEWKS
ncbi:hypothetical protein HYX00_00185 [Candidatus Woesearchaeota archaeon]|nr:hypothetical protein [Candidatus Woesearchaeota archaeon]